MESGLRAFLFTDLVGSTELLHEIGHERTERLRRAHFEVVRRAIAAHRGVEVKTIGDAFMVAFASTVDAVACAQAIQEGQAAANRRADVALSVRTAVSAGEATEENGDYFGIPVIEASRLCAAGSGGQVLVSDAARSMIPAGRFRFQKVGELALKGLPEPLPASELLFEVHQEPPRSTSFLGRAKELEALEQALARAGQGEGGVVLIAGEPGIGKTRLCDELALEAGRGGACVLWGRCWEGEGAPAFWPWLQVVRAYTRGQEPERLEADLGAGAADVAALVPEVHQMLPHIPPPPPVEPEQARFRLFDSLASFFGKAATRQPLLIVLEDVHWADRPSLLLLQFLAAQAAGTRALIACTYRDIELPRRPELGATLADLARHEHVERFVLRGLSRAESDALVAAAGLQASASLKERVHARSEGNPLFIKEYARLAQATDQGAPGGARRELGLPAKVTELIRRRLDGLSQECGQVLALAAVIGREFDARVLESAGELSPEALLGTLDEAEQARLIAEVERGTGRYSFSHALVRETLYEGLTSAARFRLHRKVGEAIERLSAADPEPHLAELAYHFGEAAPAGGAAKALDYAWRAGDQAVALMAQEEAARYYLRALELLDLSGRDDPADLGRLCLEAGRALRLAGDREQAMHLLFRAAEIARRGRLPYLLAETAIECCGEVADVDVNSVECDRILALFDEALAALPEEDAATRLRLLGIEGVLLEVLHRIGRSRDAYRQAAELAPRVSDPAALAAGAVCEFSLADPDDATLQEQYNRILRRRQLAAEGRAFGLLSDALDEQLQCAVRLGWLDEARSTVRSMVGLSRYLRVPIPYARAAQHEATLAFIGGRFDEAERFTEDARAFSNRAQSPMAKMLAWMEMTALRREQGRSDEVLARAAANAERLPGDREGARYWFCYLPLLYLDAGDREQAEQRYDRFASERFESLARIWWWNAAMGYLAEGCVRLERKAVAPLLYDSLLPHAATSIVHLSGYGCQGSTSHFLGMLAALMERREEAEGHFEAALAMHTQQLQSPNLTAKTRLEYAALLASDPAERDRALDLVYEAHATFHELGMKYLEGRSHELRARLQATAPGAAPASQGQPQVDGLTPREVEVLGLIASGLSNAGIAEQLVLSVATVERHISNIYAKIGARGRADATSYAIGHGLSARTSS